MCTCVNLLRQCRTCGFDKQPGATRRAGRFWAVLSLYRKYFCTHHLKPSVMYFSTCERDIVLLIWVCTGDSIALSNPNHSRWHDLSWAAQLTLPQKCGQLMPMGLGTCCKYITGKQLLILCMAKAGGLLEGTLTRCCMRDSPPLGVPAGEWATCGRPAAGCSSTVPRASTVLYGTRT